MRTHQNGNNIRLCVTKTSRSRFEGKDLHLHGGIGGIDEDVRRSGLSPSQFHHNTSCTFNFSNERNMLGVRISCKACIIHSLLKSQLYSNSKFK